MSIPLAESPYGTQLRLEAEGRLKGGTAPPTNVAAVSLDALSLLHRLASVNAGTGDALKLLHELQVHQVELDLQHEQIETTQRELADDLARYQGFYDFAPVGYFSIGFDGRITEGNLVGAELFGVLRDELGGRRIDSFLAPESQLVFFGLLQRLREGGTRESCVVRSDSDGSVSRQWQIVGSVLPGGGRILLIFLDTTELKDT